MTDKLPPEAEAWIKSLDPKKRPFAQTGRLSADSTERKTRSEEILTREGVPFLAHLPMIQPVSEIRFRSTAESMDRLLGLTIAAIYAETADGAWVRELAHDWQADGCFTPNERAFLQQAEPSAQHRAQFSWRYEGVWVLLWTLGFQNTLGRPDHQANVAGMLKPMFELGPAAMRGKAHLRDGNEILNALDLVYRYHWACTEARVKGRIMPAGLDGGVVMEWHYALNWITSYGDAAWDDVQTDT
ncbi:MAG TPA: DUF4272 domain-containing protein [Hyphomonadaceae bacterium]|nr:DUF4272 domain-containing protein [Hyphomonadaceae bacterium]